MYMYKKYIYIYAFDVIFANFLVHWY